MEQRGLRCRRAPLLQQNAEQLAVTARQKASTNRRASGNTPSPTT
jgi:hypothetical protein